MRNLLLSFALLCGLFVAGCGSSTPSGGSATCEAGAGGPGHTCTAYSGTGVTSSLCAGAMSVDSCPSTNALGTCTYTASAGGASITEAITYYSDGGVTAMAAQTACNAVPSATWKAN